MNIIRQYNPYASRVTNSIDETLESLFGGFVTTALLPDRKSTDYSYSIPLDHRKTPAANTRKTENGYQIDVAIPGIDKRDIKISAEGDELKIFAEREIDDEKSMSEFSLKEFSYDTFSRSFKLPRGTEHENITATHDNGVLTLNIPNYRVSESRSRIIDID